MSVQFKIKNLPEFKRQLARASDKQRGRFKDVVNANGLEVIAGAKNNVRINKTTDTGTLINSVERLERRNGGLLVIVGSHLKYAAAIEAGRPPGSMPPYLALVPWVNRKLKIRGKRARSVAYLIARKIGKRGTPAQPFLRPALISQRGRFVQDIRETFKN